MASIVHAGRPGTGPAIGAIFVTVLAAASVAFSGEAAAARAGWQRPIVVDVPVGTRDIFYHRACPGTFPVPVNGGFHLNEAAKPGFVLTGSFRRDDAPAVGKEWGWIFDWPAGAGAPAGSQVTLNIYCE
jgi:hypothetical protein